MWLYVGSSCGWTLYESFCEKRLSGLFAICMRDCDLVKRSNICDEDIRVWFLKSVFLSRGCCSGLKCFDRVANKIKNLRTSDWKFHEQKVYASYEFGAEKKLSSNYMIVGDGCGKEKEI